MTFLRRVLKVQAALWALTGVALAALPVFTVRTILDQRMPSDGAWIRMLGVTCVVLALFMVLVSQHVTETWWWAWGFAILEAGIATIAVLNALFGVPNGSLVWAWWAIGVGAIALGTLDLIGLAKAGQDKPIA